MSKFRGGDWEAIQVLATSGRNNSVRKLTSFQKSAIDRLTSRTPEVVVKVSGGGKTIGHVLKHATYITRNGKLEAITSDGDKVSMKDDLQDLLAAWGLDMAKGEGKNKLAFNIVFSMPENTPPEAVLQAVQKLARDNFLGQRDYMMVLHEPETDPSKTKSDKPHVHLVVNANGHKHDRLYIRKDTLLQWRSEFAENLREVGIEANATPRVVRGNTLKSKKHAVYFAASRNASTVQLSKFKEAAKMINEPLPIEKWDDAILIKREEIVNTLDAATKALIGQGEIGFAGKLKKFRDNLPPITTERREMKRRVLAEVLAQRERNEKNKHSEQIKEPKISSINSQYLERDSGEPDR